MIVEARKYCPYSLYENLLTFNKSTQFAKNPYLLIVEARQHCPYGLYES